MTVPFPDDPRGPAAKWLGDEAHNVDKELYALRLKARNFDSAAPNREELLAKLGTVMAHGEAYAGRLELMTNKLKHPNIFGEADLAASRETRRIQQIWQQTRAALAAVAPETTLADLFNATDGRSQRSWDFHRNEEQRNRSTSSRSRPGRDQRSERADRAAGSREEPNRPR